MDAPGTSAVCLSTCGSGVAGGVRLSPTQPEEYHSCPLTHTDPSTLPHTHTWYSLIRSTTSARPQARSWRPTAPATSASICSLIWDCSEAVALEQKGRRLVTACIYKGGGGGMVRDRDNRDV
jgi:hypothetical protein